LNSSGSAIIFVPGQLSDLQITSVAASGFELDLTTEPIGGAENDF